MAARTKGEPCQFQDGIPTSGRRVSFRTAAAAQFSPEETERQLSRTTALFREHQEMETRALVPVSARSAIRPNTAMEEQFHALQTRVPPTEQGELSLATRNFFQQMTLMA